MTEYRYRKQSFPSSRLQELWATGEKNEANPEKILGNFVAIVSHELRTPLTTIKGYAGTLQQKDKT